MIGLAFQRHSRGTVGPCVEAGRMRETKAEVGGGGRRWQHCPGRGEVAGPLGPSLGRAPLLGEALIEGHSVSHRLLCSQLRLQPHNLQLLT